MRDGRIAVVGGGPAGLMAADRLSEAGLGVDVYDGMPTVGRKFLLAGKSGLNITHAESYEDFVRRYGSAQPKLAPALARMTPDDVRAFAESLGSETFVGSSGRVFPRHMKASPLLRAWLNRLAGQGVRIVTRHRWTGFTDGGGLAFATPAGALAVTPAATVLALGGASWPRLGADGSWTSILRERGVPVAALAPSNMGFDVDWSAPFRERYAGHPVKTVVATVGGTAIPGEFVVTMGGIEGSLVYAHSAALRDALRDGEPAVMALDLVPGRSAARLSADLSRQRCKASFANALRKATGLDGVKAGLVRECLDEATRADPVRLAAALKALPIRPLRPRPIAEAISTAGGVPFDAVDDALMLTALPGVFVAGEMLDWEAPTGGYLLNACFATGRAAADGAIAWMKDRTEG
ncbi:MAG TPA: TIGR03862 family flavoprotein [Methylomirabilota bacterium]|nr:TIGR03862 family flavoprotein [Methylomirabilota bacterium]